MKKQFLTRGIVPQIFVYLGRVQYPEVYLDSAGRFPELILTCRPCSFTINLGTADVNYIVNWL
jgi:hypothetical protein